MSMEYIHFVTLKNYTPLYMGCIHEDPLYMVSLPVHVARLGKFSYRVAYTCLTRSVLHLSAHRSLCTRLL